MHVHTHTTLVVELIPRPFDHFPSSLPEAIPINHSGLAEVDKLSLLPLQETNPIIVHFSPFFSIMRDHCMAVIRAVTEAASVAENPVEFLLSKQGNVQL